MSIYDYDMYMIMMQQQAGLQNSLGAMGQGIGGSFITSGNPTSLVISNNANCTPNQCDNKELPLNKRLLLLE